MSPTDKLLYASGRERGIALAYLAQAKLTIGRKRSEFARLAREASKESVRYRLASRGIE